jgi:aconitate hydratase
MPAQTLSAKLINDHLLAGKLSPGSEISLRMDQALLQDVLGTLVMLELEGMGLERAIPQPTVQYIDHALVQQDALSADAHRFLKSACDRFGIWYSGPGNGISHPVHMEHFGVPGQSIVGSDSHTTAAGSLGMLAIGAGGIEVALAIAGQSLVIPMPEIWGIELTGTLPDWVSARDIALELLHRHGVAGAKNCILEFYGEGLASLSAMDRHIIANMGTEMGATSSVFPSDDATHTFLAARGRADDWQPLQADEGCQYDRHDAIDLSTLEPLIALPSSPGNVVKVTEAAGEPIYQSYIGSSGCPGYSEFATVAQMFKEKTAAAGVSLDINPTSRQVLGAMIEQGDLARLVNAGARIHQAGCNGCIGMGQAPAQGQNSLRTVPRNFPGRSGTKEDRVFLCSAETAAASAIRGVITDPRSLGLVYSRPPEPSKMPAANAGFVAPTKQPSDSARPTLAVTDNTPPLPVLEALPEDISVPIALKVGDDISTDDIMPAGTAIPYWCNVHASAQFLFNPIDADYPARAKALTAKGGHAIVGGDNYGQGSSRENAALIPAIQGLKVVVAKSFARIHWQNLVCFGVLPLSPATDQDAAILQNGNAISIPQVHQQLAEGNTLQTTVDGQSVTLTHELTQRQRALLKVGGVINQISQGGM